jgi:aldose 1-epimerase
MRLSILLLLSSLPAAAQYTARRTIVDGVGVIRLEDSVHRTSVSIAPSIGNIAFEMLVNGHNVLWFPYPSVGAFRDKPRICGIPLLAPWADRLDESAFYANGKKYRFNPDLGNIRLDGAGHPIHGFLSLTSDWQVLRVEADGRSARVSSLLDVTRSPEWMAQFPFAHTIEITHTLADGVLQISTRMENAALSLCPFRSATTLSTRSPTRRAMSGRSASVRRGNGQSIRNFFPRARRVRSPNLFRTPRISA